MSQRIPTAIITPIALLILAFAVLIPVSVSAQSPVNMTASDGILGDPPTTISFFFIPLVQASVVDARECPTQVGEGVLCSGPQAIDAPEFAAESAGSVEVAAPSPAE